MSEGNGHWDALNDIKHDTSEIPKIAESMAKIAAHSEWMMSQVDARVPIKVLYLVVGANVFGFLGVVGVKVLARYLGVSF